MSGPFAREGRGARGDGERAFGPQGRGGPSSREGREAGGEEGGLPPHAGIVRVSLGVYR